MSIIKLEPFDSQLSIVPSLSATMNKFSAVQQFGIQIQSLLESSGNRKPNLWRSKMNGWYIMAECCSEFQGTIGTGWFFTENFINELVIVVEKSKVIQWSKTYKYNETVLVP